MDRLEVKKKETWSSVGFSEINLKKNGHSTTNLPQDTDILSDLKVEGDEELEDKI